MELFLCRVSVTGLDDCDTDANIKTKHCLLWVAATRRSLWQGASSLNVQPYFDIHYSDVRCIVGELGSFSVDWLLGGLTRLPPEILKMIWDFCNDTWYCSVLDLARHVTAMQENNQLQDRIIPLLNVKTWVRGNAPQLEGSASGSIVRLAIDSRGLLCIERLTQLDRKISSRSDCMGYIVEAAERFNGVSVDFQVGLSTPKAPGHITNSS